MKGKNQLIGYVVRAILRIGFCYIVGCIVGAVSWWLLWNAYQSVAGQAGHELLLQIGLFQVAADGALVKAMGVPFYWVILLSWPLWFPWPWLLPVKRNVVIRRWLLGHKISLI